MFFLRQSRCFQTYTRVWQTSYFKVGKKEAETNFSRYLCLRSTWLFPKARWDITVNTYKLHPPCYALPWELVIPKNNNFIGSIAHRQVKLHLFTAIETITARNYQTQALHDNVIVPQTTATIIFSSKPFCPYFALGIMVIWR